jgi:hypothetical protein
MTEQLVRMKAQLVARYPDVRIVWAHVDHLGPEKDWKALVLRYQAPLKTLMRYGLARRYMLDRKIPPGRRFSDGGSSGTWQLGDGYMLVKSLDSESKPGHWDLCTYTGTEVPNERRGFSIKQAQRELRRIARSA